MLVALSRQNNHLLPEISPHWELIRTNVNLMIFSMIMIMRSYQVHHLRIMRATPCGSKGTKVIALDFIHDWTIFLFDIIHNWKIISLDFIHNWQIVLLDFIHSSTIILLNIIHNWTIILINIIHYLIWCHPYWTIILLDSIHNWKIILLDFIHNWTIILLDIIQNWKIILLDFTHNWTIILLDIIHNWKIIPRDWIWFSTNLHIFQKYLFAGHFNFCLNLLKSWGFAWFSFG